MQISSQLIFRFAKGTVCKANARFVVKISIRKMTFQLALATAKSSSPSP